MSLNYAILITAIASSVSCSDLSGSRNGAGLPNNMGLTVTPIGGCSFATPAGWTLDTKSGASQGVHLVAYPHGSSYSSSPVIVYSRTLPRDSKTKSAADAAAAVVRNFYSYGHSAYKAKFLTDLNTSGGKKGKLYAFEGDNWKNFEAACYFTESDTINSIVFHAKNKADYDRRWNDYLKMCKSYVPVFISN